MLAIFEWIRTAAKSDISVLILGPTGSGKEVVARMIHELSRRGTGEVPGGQLRRAARHAVRVGNLRLRKRRVHRRARPQAGPARAGQRRHAVPRRNRRPVAGRAGQAAARARRAPLRAARRQQVDPCRLPADFGHQPAARPVRAREPLPRRPLSTASTPSRSACRRCKERAVDIPVLANRFLGALLRRQRPAARRQAVLARGARAAAAAITGPATSASSKARCRAPRSRRPGRVIRAADIEFLHGRAPAPSDDPDRLPSLRDAERAHIIRVLEAVELEQARSGAGARHQPRHALPQDRGVRPRAGRHAPPAPGARQRLAVRAGTPSSTESGLCARLASALRLSSGLFCRKELSLVQRVRHRRQRRRSIAPGCQIGPPRCATVRLRMALPSSPGVRRARSRRPLAVSGSRTSTAAALRPPPALGGHVGVQGRLPLAKSGSTMSVSYAVDFAALLLLGPTRRCSSRSRARGASARSGCSQATRSTARSSAWRAWRSPCRPPGFVYLRLGGVPGVLTSSIAVEAGRSSAPRPTYFLFNTVLIAVAIALSTRQP